MAERKRREAGLPPGGGPGLAETQAGPPSAALSCPRCFAAVPAAARFCAFCGNPVARAEAEAGERRPLIVLFCDMVGSAKLSTELDPEDLTELIRDFQRRVAGVIAAYGGCVARRLGDGALVYFGYPSAAEDDAERAVRAALAVTEAMASIPAGPGHAVQVRIGLATGIAVIGDVSGTGAADALEIAGEAPNLAARLQALAEPGTVVVSDTVRNQLGGLFLWRDLGPHKLKGWTEAVRAWQPVAPARDVTRFEARQPAAPIPLIGRDAPATRLAALWREARAGAGRVVLISGEAGIGKSRLVANLLETTAGDRHARLRFSASPHQRDTPLHPVLQAIERFAGFAPGDDTDLRRRKLRAALAATPERDLALIAGLLMLPMPEQPKLAQLAPQRRRALVLQALLGLSVRLARARPILEVFEDAHWADPTSVELLGLTPRAFAGLPILMVITARPEFRPAWLAEPGVERIELEPLGAAESAEMVERVSGRAAPLPPAVIGEILRRADGVPLFLEELTRAVLEGRAAAGLREPAPAAVPSSIHASLLARLDRLGAARNLAEVAAAIGREFGLDLLGRVAGLRPEELEVPMARLLASGLVHPAGPSGGRSYRFKHALICDAAYGTILRTRRRELHARIAEALEAAASQDGPARPQLLAHHYTEAGLAAPAARWWLAAGLQSLQQSAMTEALAQLRRGLTLAAELPEAEPRLRLELELWIACTKALFVTAGWAAEATGEAFAHARALCDRLGTPPQLRTVLFGQWLRALVRGEPQAALAQAEDVLARGIALGDPEWRLLGHYCVGMTQLPLGGFALVKQHLGAGIALFDPAKREAYAGPVVGDPRVIMRTYRAWAMLCTGAYAEAWAESATALAEAREAGQALALAHALWHRAYQTVAVEGVPEALAALQPLWPVVNEHGLAFYQGLGGILQGWCLGRLGDPRGLTALRAGLEGYRRTGSRNHLSSFLRMEAEVLGATGAAAEGLDRAEAAGRLMRETGEGWDAAEIARVRGTLLHQLGETASAEAALREARARAAAQGAVWFGLRAAVSLARLLAETGRREAAREVLAPEAEAEGPCMDLREARALLAELGG